MFFHYQDILQLSNVTSSPIFLVVYHHYTRDICLLLKDLTQEDSSFLQHDLYINSCELLVHIVVLFELLISFYIFLICANLITQLESLIGKDYNLLALGILSINEYQDYLYFQIVYLSYRKNHIQILLLFSFYQLNRDDKEITL